MQVKPKISCRSIWKVFGAGPAEFMARHGNNPQPADFKAEGYIGAARNVSFDVYPGEILMIMGLSGSGKSTLVRAITRLNDPTAGSVLIDGVDLMQASPKELVELRRHKMGMVFQNFGLLPHRTVLSNVAFPLEVRGTPKDEREKRAREMIRLVGLEGREAYFPRELSGGQQQRVGIARSLAVGPDIWFLDEPFSALDPLIRREMQDEFLRLQKILKKTIIFITHDFAEAARLGDRIGIMKDGELVQLAPPAEMVANPANDYVREFTREAPRDQIITVGSICDRDDAAPGGEAVAADAKLHEVASKVLSSQSPIAVVGSDGTPLGSVSRQSMIAALYPGRTQ
ncbi:betaine/proline/choline family ABC transporter ATP-binding protein [Sinorhizobium medicae]|uniref:Quaternary amine transport ATP-binding protein n=2 Tax=Sinorhizobium medicae TaxID=110321 RepID=A0A508X0W8_9HYPH|nr:betaine/proline/choline family ABC transporter ATP-binding protein [Sinorhizobium medicae]MDX0422358.1 betaine/proline/choline family ABC transporter ATP-binding protein [Sinorhizobium medicae]MDX0429503.1 betaine/proline/choline family ABC transporter ATP-binding protein [Sinorhizobium medicae]MDX0443091.1 betaine/proline/choline family ABC transporter ATP-binding protein [Sinorhizobium medicae]MDX0461188.1 betaine/proline/choline family ABC transporter ATP-binding protein [Sinorhizobium me